MGDFGFPFPVLVCDVGGTNVRLALIGAPDAPLGDVVHLKTWDYPGLVEAIEAGIPKLGARPRSAIACGAGPVVDRTLKLTNAPWIMDGREIARRLTLGQGLLLNDFEAQALSLQEYSAWIGERPRVVRVTGGASRNRGILQVLADVLQAEICTISVQNSSALGGALRAAQALERSAWTELYTRFVSPEAGSRVLSSPDASGAYAALRAKFVGKLRQIAG